MQPSRTPRLAAALLLIPLAARAQPPEASLLDALSLISGGLLAPSDPPPRVAHDGDLYRVRVPLPGLAEPPDAAVEATARPVGTGIWDITALTLPQAGVINTPGQAAAAPGILTFAIGQQSFHGKVDTTLATPSPFKAQLGKITLRTENAPQHTDQTIEQYSTDGTLSGDGHGRLNAHVLGALTNWLITGAGDKPSDAFRLSMRSAAIRYDVEGLDRTRAEHLRTTLQNRPPAAPTASLTLSPAARERLHAMIDDFGALLTRFDIDETIQGVHFEAAGTSKVEVANVRLGLAGDSRGGRVNAHLDIDVADPSANMVPPDYAALMPHRVAIRPAVSGVRSEALMQWLREATADKTETAALQASAMALLNDPQARVGVESLAIETGPLTVQGSAKVLPLPGNSIGYSVHLTARGLDGMMATLQGNPQAMQMLPMMYLAKGMAKPQGDSLVWDINYANGAVTVNNVPLAQSPAKR
nr:hypothetical protein [uncultured Rhodopila sp.]